VDADAADADVEARDAGAEAKDADAAGADAEAADAEAEPEEVEAVDVEAAEAEASDARATDAGTEDAEPVDDEAADAEPVDAEPAEAGTEGARAEDAKAPDAATGETESPNAETTEAEPAGADGPETTEAAAAGAAGDGADGEPSADSDDGPRERMEQALKAVRREGQKAAAIYAVVDAVAAFLLVNVLLAVVAPPDVLAPVAIADVTGVVVLAGVVGVVVLAVELWLRTRGSLVERFERANPEIAGPLRTARDIASTGTDTRMAARLYEETLERLREASGLALVDSRRIAATGLVIVVLCLASVQVTVIGLSLFGADGPGPAVEDEPEAVTPGFDGLRDGGEVLGDPSAVDRGDDNVSVEVTTNEGDGPVDEQRSFPSDGDGSAAGADVETRQAGYSDPERIENAELVREYNVRIREEE
jgi:hypothetical protein